MKATFKRDNIKRLSYKHASTCHDAELVQKMLFKGKVVPEGFKLTGVEQHSEETYVRRKWWKVWKPRLTTVTTTKERQSHRAVQFRYFCSECDSQDNGEWAFRHDKGQQE